jgi:hypothetical protein
MAWLKDLPCGSFAPLTIRAFSDPKSPVKVLWFRQPEVTMLKKGAAEITRRRSIC